MPVWFQGSPQHADSVIKMDKEDFEGLHAANDLKVCYQITDSCPQGIAFVCSIGLQNLCLYFICVLLICGT